MSGTSASVRSTSPLPSRLTSRLAAASARERTVRLHPALGGLTDALQRGSTVGFAGHAAWSVALAVAAQPCADGAWVAVLGAPALGVQAAVEAGLVGQRLVSVAEPERRGDERRDDDRWGDDRWGDVLAAAIDGFDVVIAGPQVQRLRAGTARRVQARVQQRGALLLVVHPQRTTFAADVGFTTIEDRWQGLGDGHGVARGRSVHVQLEGRRMPRPRRAYVEWPLSRPAAEPLIERPVEGLGVDTRAGDGALRPVRPVMAHAG